jgi:hypothetical protein
MIFNGVEILKLQFSRAIDQTFEHFLDSWSMPSGADEPFAGDYTVQGQSSEEIPVFGPN